MIQAGSDLLRENSQVTVAAANQQIASLCGNRYQRNLFIRCFLGVADRIKKELPASVVGVQGGYKRLVGKKWKGKAREEESKRESVEYNNVDKDDNYNKNNNKDND